MTVVMGMVGRWGPVMSVGSDREDVRRDLEVEFRGAA